MSEIYRFMYKYNKVDEDLRYKKAKLEEKEEIDIDIFKIGRGIEEIRKECKWLCRMTKIKSLTLDKIWRFYSAHFILGEPTRKQ